MPSPYNLMRETLSIIMNCKGCKVVWKTRVRNLRDSEERSLSSKSRLQWQAPNWKVKEDLPKVGKRGLQ